MSTKTQTTQEPRYKIKTCTTNCTQYRAEKGKIPCKKGNFAFVPPLGERCTFSLLEGQMEYAQTPPSRTQQEPTRTWVYSRGKETEVTPRSQGKFADKPLPFLPARPWQEYTRSPTKCKGQHVSALSTLGPIPEHEGLYDFSPTSARHEVVERSAIPGHDW